jgi:hypothetical protein
VVAAGALGMTACTDSQATTGRVTPGNTVAPLGPVTSEPPIRPPDPTFASAQQFIDDLVGVLSPREMGVCPGLRAQPELSRQDIRRSFDLPFVHEQAARFGYSNDELVDMIMSAYSKRLEAEC